MDINPSLSYGAVRGYEDAQNAALLRQQQTTANQIAEEQLSQEKALRPIREEGARLNLETMKLNIEDLRDKAKLAAKAAALTKVNDVAMRQYIMSGSKDMTAFEPLLKALDPAGRDAKIQPTTDAKTGAQGIRIFDGATGEDMFSLTQGNPHWLIKAIPGIPDAEKANMKPFEQLHLINNVILKNPEMLTKIMEAGWKEQQEKAATAAKNEHELRKVREQRSPVGHIPQGSDFYTYDAGTNTYTVTERGKQAGMSKDDVTRIHTLIKDDPNVTDKTVAENQALSIMGLNRQSGLYPDMDASEAVIVARAIQNKEATEREATDKSGTPFRYVDVKGKKYVTWSGEKPTQGAIAPPAAAGAAPTPVGAAPPAPEPAFAVSKQGPSVNQRMTPGQSALEVPKQALSDVGDVAGAASDVAAVPGQVASTVLSEGVKAVGRAAGKAIMGSGRSATEQRAYLAGRAEKEYKAMMAGGTTPTPQQAADFLKKYEKVLHPAQIAKLRQIEGKTNIAKGG